MKQRSLFHLFNIPRRIDSVDLGNYRCHFFLTWKVAIVIIINIAVDIHWQEVFGCLRGA